MDDYPVRVGTPVEATKTIRIEAPGISRRAGETIGYAGRYDKAHSALQRLETLKKIAHVAAGTSGTVVDYSDEILVKFTVGASHDTIAIWIKRFHFGQCVKILGMPPA